QAAHRRVRPLDERARVLLVRDVELARVDLAGEVRRLGGERGEAVLVDVAGGDQRARLGETAREVRAHAAGGAGDDDLEVGELHRRCFPQWRAGIASRGRSHSTSAGYISRAARPPTTAPTWPPATRNTCVSLLDTCSISAVAESHGQIASRSATIASA